MIKTLRDGALGLAASFTDQEDFAQIFAVSFIKIYLSGIPFAQRFVSKIKSKKNFNPTKD